MLQCTSQIAHTDGV